jgi:hypothetical protein
MRKQLFSTHLIFAFPSNGIKAEATPNTEMTLIVDVDMNLLKELHEHGSVNTMKDRRHDLYNLTRLNNEKLFRMRGENYRSRTKVL